MTLLTAAACLGAWLTTIVTPRAVDRGPFSLMTNLPANCSTGDMVLLTSNVFYVCTSMGVFTQVSWAGAVPSGSIVLLAAGACAPGWTEATELDGRTIVMTTTAHGNVGTTGGSDTVTPVVQTEMARVAGGFLAVTAVAPFDNRAAFVRLLACRKI
jgi:hypothetical protein